MANDDATRASSGEPVSTPSISELNASFMRCVECHSADETRHHLLRAGCTPQPQLKVRQRPWFPPRGWAGSLTPGPRTVFAISTNPGHPLPAEEAVWAGYPTTQQEASRLTEAQARAQLKFVTKLYVERPGTTAFHTRSVQLARAILWLVSERDGAQASRAPWFDQVWFTDVVKCSTAQETGSPGIAALAARCRCHLRSEVSALQPRVFITLGSRARDALAAAGVEVPVLVAAPHPSGRQWRRIDSPEWDDIFAAVAQALGVQWADVKSRLAEVRTQLAQFPRNPL